ncbi:MAG: hypothetical protein JWN98_505, partial [Abditibacteriota bacterium]|nr:hypothetical protein [Abditibacteriota bacterium]
MKTFRIRFIPIVLLAVAASALLSWNVVAQNNRRNTPPNAGRTVGSTQSDRQSTLMRPQYQLSADIDWELLTFRSQGDITVPVAPGDSMRDVVFFVFANAGGVGGSDARRKNIAVDDVSLDGAKVLWSLNGPVLRVRLPQPRSQA